MKWTKKLNFDSPSKISIQPDVGMITKKDRPFSEGLIQFLLINVIALSSIFTGLSYIDIHTSVFLLMCESLLISVILCFSKSRITKAAVISACAFILLWLRNDIIKGAFLLIDEYAQLLDMPFKAPFRPEAVLTDYAAVTLFLSAYLLLMLLVLYYSVFITKNFIFTFAISFIMPEIGLYNGDVPNYISAFMLVAAWVCVFAMQLNDYHANRAGKKNVFTRQKKKNVFYMTQRGMKNSAFGQLCVQLCIFMAAALLLAVAGSSFAGYKRSDRINVMRRELTYDFSVKTIVNTLQELSGLDLPIGFPSVSDLGSAAVSGGMAKGDLSKVNDIRFLGKQLMNISFDFLPTYDLYLRGFAAGNYSDSHWRNAKAEDMHFNELQIMSSVYSALGGGYAQSMYNNRITIEDLTKSDILFAPYFSSFLGMQRAKDVSYDYLTIKGNNYSLDYSGFDASPEEVYGNTENITNYSSFDLAGYFLASYHIQLSEDPTVSPNDVLEQLPIRYIIQNTGKEDQYMKDMIHGMNTYLNYGMDQTEFYAYLYAYLTDPIGNETIDERYPIILEYLDGSGEHLTSENMTFNELATIAYRSFQNIDNFNGIIEDTRYMNYVFENYTNVDIELNADVVGKINSALMEKYPFGIGNMTGYVDYIPFIDDYATRAAEIVDQIKLYFALNYAYSLQNPKTPEGEDFIEYFLGNMDTGSCTYFSSAAVQLLRYFGIPARYAEGFMIPSKQLRTSSTLNSDTGKYEMTVLDNYAHAWVEIYMPGIGWLPVDFTLSVQQMDELVATTTTTSGEETSESTTTTVTTTSAQAESTTTVTTAPQGSASETITTTGNGSGNGSTGSKGGSKIKGILLTVGAATLIIAMFVLAYLACISAIKRGLKDSINEANENRRAVNIYDLVLTYLACIGIRSSENISDKDRCERLCEMLEKAGITGLSDELRAACELAVEAGMSGGEITPEENEQMIALLKKVRGICYEKMSKIQKFTAKYIKGLY